MSEPMSEELAVRMAKVMFDKLIAEDGAWALAQGHNPVAITLDGTFDLVDLARAVIDAAL